MGNWSWEGSEPYVTFAPQGKMAVAGARISLEMTFVS
jgi:hypothetical protein